jgi:hypothetical protein
MSAATEALPTSVRPGTIRNMPVLGATRIWQGTLAAVTLAGFLRPAVATNVTDKVVGLAQDTADNSSGADGALALDVGLGTFEIAYTGTAPTNADIGAKLYVADDNTVTLTPGGLVAGEVFDLSETTGLVVIKFLNGAPSGAINSLTADGAIPVAPGLVLLSKAGVGAFTLAAPATNQNGLTLDITNTTANAHVITATGLIQDGVTGGAKITATFAAFAGSSLTLKAVAGKWHVFTKNVVTIA